MRTFTGLSQNGQVLRCMTIVYRPQCRSCSTVPLEGYKWQSTHQYKSLRIGLSVKTQLHNLKPLFCTQNNLSPPTEHDLDNHTYSTAWWSQAIVKTRDNVWPLIGNPCL